MDFYHEFYLESSKVLLLMLWHWELAELWHNSEFRGNKQDEPFHKEHKQPNLRRLSIHYV